MITTSQLNCYYSFINFPRLLTWFVPSTRYWVRHGGILTGMKDTASKKSENQRQGTLAKIGTYLEKLKGTKVVKKQRK